MFSAQDKLQIKDKGISIETIEYQLDRFENGFPSADVVRPATNGDGIIKSTDEEKELLASYFEEKQQDNAVCRFVPASGAATRMFKVLFGLRDELSELSPEAQVKYIAGDKEARFFFEKLEQFPFESALKNITTESPYKILCGLLDDDGLAYGSKPKGMLLFHQTEKGAVTAFEEHLHEAVAICSAKKEIHLHFTVSQEHLSGFEALELAIVPVIEKTYGVKFQISYSFQKGNTDTLAVHPDNSPFRNDEGKLQFRPGGHGALIQNLNDIHSDIVFLNNIDNVSPGSNRASRALNKKYLGGLLMKTKSKVHAILTGLISGNSLSAEKVMTWMKNDLFIDIPESVVNAEEEEQLSWIFKKLNRPIRVCGMVKNEGEPGGGPYHMRNSSGETSLQVVELSQLDMEDSEKVAIANSLTHFNPVDLVCWVKDFAGDSFDLLQYIDKDTGFISEKSLQGKDLKALELPGLWNGSMSDWITLFAEVPGSTFTPVKTVFDLIRPAHLGA